MRILRRKLLKIKITICKLLINKDSSSLSKSVLPSNDLDYIIRVQLVPTENPILPISLCFGCKIYQRIKTGECSILSEWSNLACLLHDRIKLPWRRYPGKWHKKWCWWREVSWLESSQTEWFDARAGPCASPIHMNIGPYENHHPADEEHYDIKKKNNNIFGQITPVDPAPN